MKNEFYVLMVAGAACNAAPAGWNTRSETHAVWVKALSAFLAAVKPELRQWSSGIDNRGTRFEHPESKAGKPTGVDLSDDPDYVLVALGGGDNNVSMAWLPRAAMPAELIEAVEKVRRGMYTFSLVNCCHAALPSN